MNCFDPICLFCQELLKCPNELKFAADLTHQIIYHAKKWIFFEFSIICFELFSDREQMSLGTDLDIRSICILFNV